MDLRLIVGPPRSRKAGRIVESTLAAAAQHGDAFLCVPGTVDRARFVRELAARGNGMHLGVEVGTFDQLIARVAGSPPVRRADRAMERVVVRDALDDVAELAPAARWSGFVETARHHVSQLRRARAWHGATAQVLRVESELPGGDLAIWRRLEERVGELLAQRHLRDDAWFEQRAARAIRAGTPGAGAVLVYGFEALEPTRVELLEQLAHHVPVTVALTWRPGRHVHERAADLRDRWREAGAHVEELAEEADARSQLQWLGSELYEDAPLPMPHGPEQVQFVECCGTMQEAEEVVREAAQLAASGLAWDDIAVASASAGIDGDVLLAAFERAGIPARLQSRRAAVDVPAGRTIHGILEAVISDEPLQLIALARSPIVGGDRQRLAAAELRLRGAASAGRRGAGSSAVASQLPRALQELMQAHARDRGVVAATRSLLTSLHPKDLGQLELIRALLVLLDGLVAAAADERSLQLSDIRDAIASFPLATPDRSDAGTIVIASLHDLRSVTYEAVILRSMHAGSFQASVDDEAQAPAAGRDLLHLAVTRARSALRVVRQRAGADGGHLAPSSGWSELRRLVPDAPLRSRRLGEVLVAPSGVLLSSERAASAALALGAGVEVADIDGATRATIDAARPTTRGSQLPESIVAAIAASPTIAVTRVERYATCSAKWFIEQELKVSDPDEDRSRLVEGELAHALLQRLVPDARSESWSPDQIEQVARQLAPQLASDLDRRKVLDPPRIERITAHVVSLIAAEAAWQAPDLIETERAFGREQPDSIGPGLLVDDVELIGRIDRLDRYGHEHVLHDYKYSSSPRPASTLLETRSLQLLVYWLALEHPEHGAHPVGAVYRAITDGGSASGVLSPKLRDIGMIGPRVKAGVLDDDQRRELLDAALVVVSTAVTSMRAGHVAALEDRSRCPEHCQLQPICRIDEAPP